MQELPITAKIWKLSSGSYVITIPKDYVTQGLLEEGKEYDFIVNEVKDKVQS